MENCIPLFLKLFTPALRSPGARLTARGVGQDLSGHGENRLASRSRKGVTTATIGKNREGLTSSPKVQEYFLRRKRRRAVAGGAWQRSAFVFPPGQRAVFLSRSYDQTSLQIQGRPSSLDTAVLSPTYLRSRPIVPERRNPAPRVGSSARFLSGPGTPATRRARGETGPPFD